MSLNSTGGPFPELVNISTQRPVPSMSESLQRILERLQVGSDFHKYATPVIAGLGILGNIFALMLMQRASMKSTSTSVYLSTLAVADSFVLIQHMATHWVYFHSSNPYLLESDIVCKIGEWAFMFGANWAAWVVVSLTTERFIVTTFPFQGRRWCTRRSALIVVSSLSGVIAVFWLILVFIWGVDGDGPCDRKSQYYEFAQKYGYWIAATTYTLIPTPILLVLNLILVWRLSRALLNRRRMTSSGSSSDLATRGKDAYSGAIYRVTATAVTVSIVYLVLTLPTSLVNVCSVSGILDLTDPDILCVHLVLLVLRTSNHSINFTIYILTSVKMRSEFVAMMASLWNFCRSPMRRLHSARSMDAISRGTELSTVTMNQETRLSTLADSNSSPY